MNEYLAGQAEPAKVPMEDLVARLWSLDGVTRKRARQQLVDIGSPAVGLLVEALRADNHYVRWEAAKALGQIGDAAAAPALVDTMEDEDSAVRWLAAGALIGMGCEALEPVLQALEHCADSVWLREGAYHVLHAVKRHDLHARVAPVMAAIRGLEPPVEVPWEARATRNALAGSSACEEEEQGVPA